MMRKNIPPFLALLIMLIPIGFSVVLSVSPTDLRSKDPNFNGPAWLVTVSVDASCKSDEWIIGTISSDEIKDPDTGAKAQKDLTIKFKPTKQECLWRIQESKYSITLPVGGDIFQAKTSNIYGPFNVYIDDFVSLNCQDVNAFPQYIKNIINDCQYPDCIAVYMSAPGPIVGWCRVALIYAPKVGTLYKPNTYGIKYGAEVILETEGKRTDSKTFYNIGESGYVNVSGWLTSYGEKVAFVELTGSIGSGYFCPFGDVRDDWYVVGTAEGRYGLVGSDIVNAYKRCLQEELYNSLSEWDGVHDTQLRQDVSMCNEHYYSMINAPSAVTVDYGIFKGVTLRIIGDIVKMVTNTLIERPVLRLIIKADWIGVYIPVPKPTITKVESPPKLYTNQPESVKVYVKNSGETGAIVAEMHCDGATATPSPQVKSIEEGDTDYFEFIVSSALTSSKKIPCEVKVYPKKDPSKVSKYTFTMDYEYNIKCTNIGERWCSVDKYGRPVIKECTSDGRIIIVDKCYEYGSDYICGIVGTSPKCIKKTGGEKKEEIDITKWIPLAVSGVAVLIGFGMFLALLLTGGSEAVLPAFIVLLGSFIFGIGITLKVAVLVAIGAILMILGLLGYAFFGKIKEILPR